MYSLQMLHQKVEFSVVGFFVLDYTLIYSVSIKVYLLSLFALYFFQILGAVTTYLVIFIQFDQSQFSLTEPPSTSDTIINTTTLDYEIVSNL